jgi:hypothetical protein
MAGMGVDWSSSIPPAALGLAAEAHGRNPALRAVEEPDGVRRRQLRARLAPVAWSVAADGTLSSDHAAPRESERRQLARRRCCAD